VLFENSILKPTRVAAEGMLREGQTNDPRWIKAKRKKEGKTQVMRTLHAGEGDLREDVIDELVHTFRHCRPNTQLPRLCRHGQRSRVRFREASLWEKPEAIILALAGCTKVDTEAKDGRRATGGVNFGKSCGSLGVIATVDKASATLLHFRLVCKLTRLHHVSPFLTFRCCEEPPSLP
jgi:hypothetical protein